MTISYIIPSINRESLHKTLASIEMWSEDEICVEFDLPKSGGWGNEQRNKAIDRAKGDYLAFIDDDDVYIKGYRQIFSDAIKEHPDKPHLFRIQYPDGNFIWKDKKIYPGNISTQQILIPNNPKMFFPWVKRRNMADFIFVDTWLWPEVIWHDEIIVNMGHNDGL